MPTEPQPPSLAAVARRAVEICDPGGANEALAEYLQLFEDRDEPITALGDPHEEAFQAARRVDPGEEDPAVATAAAVTTYLAFKRDQLSADDADVLRLAARSEFDGNPPARVAEWLAERGLKV